VHLATEALIAYRVVDLISPNTNVWEYNNSQLSLILKVRAKEKREKRNNRYCLKV
jgi:hypothetical protein